MKVKAFGAWPVRNNPNDGRKNSGGEYNKSFKGSPYLNVEEYASRKVEDYHHYSEWNDITDKEYERQSGSSQSDQDSKAKNSRAKRQRMLQQVVGIVAGSVVIVTSYQSEVKQQQQQQAISEPTSIVQIDDTDNSNLPGSDIPVDQGNDKSDPDGTQSGQEGADGILTNWTWSDDKKTVTLKLTDNNGNTLKELPAKVSVAQVAATCNKAGTTTYTATADDGEKTYSDSQTETITPLGHDFNEGEEVVLENGHTAMTFECARCHEKITIETSISEND